MQRSKLEEVFNLPEVEDLTKANENVTTEIATYSAEEIHDVLERADKIDAALPEVGGLERIDSEYDDYAQKAIDTFDDLVMLGKNVEDRHVADIYQAAGNMMANALNAKTNKAKKKIEMIKMQISKARLEHEKDKLKYLKERHLGRDDAPIETTGKIVATRNDMINSILESVKNEENDK